MVFAAGGYFAVWVPKDKQIHAFAGNADQAHSTGALPSPSGHDKLTGVHSQRLLPLPPPTSITTSTPTIPTTATRVIQRIRSIPQIPTSISKVAILIPRSLCSIPKPIPRLPPPLHNLPIPPLLHQRHILPHPPLRLLPLLPLRILYPFPATVRADFIVAHSGTESVELVSREAVVFAVEVFFDLAEGIEGTALVAASTAEVLFEIAF